MNQHSTLFDRLQTVAQADYIVVMDAGRVVDSGTPADLEARCALYRSLSGVPIVTPGAGA